MGECVPVDQPVFFLPFQIWKVFRLWHFQLLAIILLRLNYVNVRTGVGSRIFWCFLLLFVLCVYICSKSRQIFFNAVFFLRFILSPLCFIRFHIIIQNDEIVKMIMVRLFGDDCLWFFFAHVSILHEWWWCWWWCQSKIEITKRHLLTSNNKQLVNIWP